jgi:hypothetical protein
MMPTAYHHPDLAAEPAAFHARRTVNSVIEVAMGTICHFNRFFFAPS